MVTETPEQLLAQVDVESAGHYMPAEARLQRTCHHRAGLLALAVQTHAPRAALADLAQLLQNARHALALASARETERIDRVVAAQDAVHASWERTRAQIADLPTTEKD